MKILVTGASGFIGRALVEGLLARGHSVAALVREESAVSPGAEARIVPDIRLIREHSDIFKDIDVVIHLAGKAHILRTPTPAEIEEVCAINAGATGDLAALARDAGVRRFVLVSSAGVFGNSTPYHKPASEETPPNPQEMYSHTKWSAERTLIETAGEKMEAVIVRPPLVYGADAPGNFGDLIRLCDHSWPLPFGNIRNKRSMIYVENLVDALALVATHSDAAGELYVVRDGEDMSTRRLVKTLSHALGRSPWLVPIPLFCLKLACKLLRRPRAYERLTDSFILDDRKIRTTLGWRPPFTVVEAMRQVAQKYRLAQHQPS